MNTTRTTKKVPRKSKETVHLPLEIGLWKASKQQADSEHRTHVNLIQVALIEYLEKRGVKL